MTPIKTNLSLSISFFPYATAYADRCASGTNSSLEINNFDLTSNILKTKVVSNITFRRFRKCS